MLRILGYVHSLGMESKNRTLDPSDVELLRAARRDPEAFLLFYRMHADWLYRWLLLTVRDRELASDLTAEAFAQALLGLTRFRGDEAGAGTAWLFGIARNLVRRTARRERLETAGRRKLGMALSAYAPDSLDEVDARIDADRLRAELGAALGTLPTTLREAFEMRVVEDLSYAEIASATGLSEPNVRMRVSRAARALATRLTLKEEKR